MIETRAALDNLDAIAGVDGIDGLFLGPSDLSIALSQRETLDPHSEDVENGLARLIEAARKAGKIPAPIAATPSALWRCSSAASAILLSAAI